MLFSVGDKLGPYEILAPIGAGGMGEVYRALDTRLNREVAIKVSQERFSNRFEREARAIAALNHPNICHLYDVGPNYLVMELLEGESPKGPLPLEKALDYARQIADALEVAHEKGIVHRDLKPANIKITPDGKVKVLDFGLAKTIQSGGKPHSPEDSPTLTNTATQTGVILGTALYMSPEQARGKNVDKRADIWAFGVVLYELLVGERPFHGEDLTEILASVVKESPDLSRVPLKARRLLGACLEKDPQRRLRDIGDAWRLLEEAPATAVRSPMAKVLPWAIAGLVTIALGVEVLHRPTGEVPRRVALQLPLPENGTLYWNAPPTVSPDGRSVAFGAVVEGKSGIWVRELDSAGARPLPETKEATTLAWSPDSRSIAFMSPNRTLKRVDLANGRARTICDLPHGFGGASWGANDTIVFTDAKGTWRVPASGGTPSVVAALDPATEVWHTNPWYLPDGRHFLIAITGKKAEDSAIFACDIDSKDQGRNNRRRVLASGLASFTYAQGHLLYLRGRTLMAQPFDPGQLETTGDPVSVAGQHSGMDQVGCFTKRRPGVYVGRDRAGAAHVVRPLRQDAGRVWTSRHNQHAGYLAGRLNGSVRHDGRIRGQRHLVA
jgi:eukaryotic-like serine/threonine-protein kinase